MSRRDQAAAGRPSLDDDDVEAHNEQSPLLGTRNVENGATATQRAPETWSEYPAYAWNRTSSAVSAAATSMRGQASRRRLGKGRQVGTQRTAGAGDSQQGGSHAGTGLKARYRSFKRGHPKTYMSLAISAGIFVFALFLFLVALLHLIFITLRAPSDATQQRIAQRALAVEGPDKVEVVSVDERGVTISIDGRIGMSSDIALNEWLGSRGSQKWWARKERTFVEWVIGKVHGVQVDVGTVALRSPDWTTPRPIEWLDLIPDEKDDSALQSISEATVLQAMNLVTFNLEPIQIQLPPVGGKEDAAKPVADQPLHLTVVAAPSGPNLLAFAQHVLDNKTAFLDIRLDNARVRGMSGSEWAGGKLRSALLRWGVPGWVNVKLGETWQRVAQKLPKMPGNDTNPDEFLNLTRYDFQELSRGGQRALGLDIQAEAANPLGKLLVGHVGWSLPFGAYLPLHENSTDPEDTVLLAAVATEPLDINGEKKIPLRLHGRVIQPPQISALSKRSQQQVLSSHTGGAKTQDDPGAEALSNFLSRFLRGDPNTLIVRGGSPFRPPMSTLSKKKPDKTPSDTPNEEMPGNGDELPAWLDRLLRVMAVPIAFPGSKVTDLIQNVSIEDLKITPHPFEREKLVCSGTILGVLNMPGQLATVNVEITDLWPDVLIFNGKPPSLEHPGNNTFASTSISDKKKKKPDDNDDTPVPDPLPDPLPEHAFGRVVPHTWAPATTMLDPDDPLGQRKLLRSELKNVPFTVLPGRGAEFRSFSWKIVTGEGARAGIEGKSKAKIWNSGLGKLTLSNMPVKGVFTVGKRGSTPGDGDDDGDDGFQLG